MNIDTETQQDTGKQNVTNHQKIIHHDHVNFIPGMQRWFHIHKSVNVIPHIKRSKNENQMIFHKMQKGL